MNLLRRLIKKIEVEFKSAFLSTVKIGNVKVVLDRETMSGKMIKRLCRGTYEQPESRMITEYISSNDKVLELGAGIGYIGTLLSRIVGGDQVFCYEANVDLIDIIQLNHKLNKVKPTIFNKVLTSDDMNKGEKVPFYVAEDFFSSSFIKMDRAIRIDELELCSIDDEISKFKVNTIVMDVEGYEYQLFNNWLVPESIRKILVEIHPSKVKNSYDLGEKLEKQGFHIDSQFKDEMLLIALR